MWLFIKFPEKDAPMHVEGYEPQRDAWIDFREMLVQDLPHKIISIDSSITGQPTSYTPAEFLESCRHIPVED